MQIVTKTVHRENRKVLVTVLTTGAVCELGLLLGKLAPKHIVLITVLITLCFQVLVMPLWPDKWTYAPETSFYEITARWLSSVPEGPRRIVNIVRVVLSVLFVGFAFYLSFDELVRPLLHRL